MKIPFTIDQFFGIFAQYNVDIWPAQVVAYLLAAASVALVFMKVPFAGRVMSGTLGIFWVWMGAVYHIGHFSTINPAARVFGVMFIVQGVLFFLFGVVKPGLSFSPSRTAYSMVGMIFVLYAMALYPLLGSAFGHHYPAAPMFGVAPCPTTIFTVGVLLWASSRVPVLLLPIPLLWSIVGMSAAISLRVPQDYGLFVAGVLGTIMIVLRNRNMSLEKRAL
jgi:hypothetical protein